MTADRRPGSRLLSIVTVCFNSERTIGETLRSVDPLLQACGDEVEHLIVDGASADATLEIVRSHPSPARSVISEPDAGIYAAMNKGLGRVRGEYVWFLNSDDLLHARFSLSRASLLDALRARRPQVLIGEVQMFRDAVDGPRATRYWRVPGDLGRALRFGWHPPHPAFIARKELLSALGGFDESKRIAADFKLMQRAMRRVVDDAVLFPEPLVAMREGGVSNGSPAAILFANRECYRSLREMGLPTGSAALEIAVKLARKVAQKAVRPRFAGAFL